LRRVEAAQKPAAVAAVMKEEGLACFEIIFYWGADSRTIMPGITLPLGSLNLAFDFFVPSAMAKAFEANWDGPTKKWDPPPESFGIRLRTPQGKN
ncbi:MAG: hypothetical protein KGH63_04670, partial [Candidatus Micrarchaeota archaeon]|nr:hypothetical protein [Candidatus Micrarchaeota archaeon]